jgi:tricarballylate dehydrogenase
MRRHGVHFQPSLSGALHTARTNAFFMGGGKALVNAYYRSAQRWACASATTRRSSGWNCARGASSPPSRPAASASRRATCVLASGGFESNRGWLREAWGANERGEWPADRFLIRGTRFNTGVLLRFLIDAGADTIGDPRRRTWWPSTRARRCTTAASARASTASRWASSSTVRRERFYDEGEDFWPKRYAIWGRLVAQQPGQDRRGPSSMRRRSAASCRRCSRARSTTRWTGWRAGSAWTGASSCTPSRRTTPPAVPAASTTRGSTTAAPAGCCPRRRTGRARSTHRRFRGYPLRPGVTFTYLGLKTDATAAVRFGGRPSPNLFVAGEMMAGNVLGKGYTAGVGMSIGTAFGRIAGHPGRAGLRGHHLPQTADALD